MQKPITEPGKGSYWTVDSSAGEGNKRERKRNRRTGVAQQAQQAAAAGTASPSSANQAIEHSSSEEESIAQSTRMSHSHGQPSVPPFEPPTYEEPTIDPALLNQGPLAGQAQMQPSRSPNLGPALYARPAFPSPIHASVPRGPRSNALGEYSMHSGQATTYGQPVPGQGPSGFDAWEASFMAPPPMWGVQASASVQMGTAGPSNTQSAPPSSIYHRGANPGSFGTGGSSSSSTSEAGSVHSIAESSVPQFYRRDSGSSSSSSSRA